LPAQVTGSSFISSANSAAFSSNRSVRAAIAASATSAAGIGNASV
jgi:hypothetical protein